MNQSKYIKEISYLKGRKIIIKELIVDRNKEIRRIKVKKVTDLIRSNINDSKKNLKSKEENKGKKKNRLK